ncbi:MAG: hypothetical protein ACC655_11665, partial [Rhodothermia bacterium]
ADSIAAVGSSADILSLAAADTRVIDLEGRTVIPGLWMLTRICSTKQFGITTLQCVFRSSCSW